MWHEYEELLQRVGLRGASIESYFGELTRGISVGSFSLVEGAN